MPDFEWAMFNVDQRRAVRRRIWPMPWRVWFCDSAGDKVCGWGNQVGMADAERRPGLGTDGTYYWPTWEDRQSDDWELL